MMRQLKQFVKQFLPAPVLSAYHKTLAFVGAALYGFPSRKLVVIGVTGTKGKSTTSNVLWKILTDAGYTVGLTGTINYRIGSRQWLSTKKMTMVGRFQMQKLLRQMVREGCDMAIVETTSEGIKQWRHTAIAYDIAVFTNLTPEHLESHGGFEQYKAAKLKLFEHIARLPKKILNGKTVVRASVINMDSEHAADFLSIGDFTKVRVGGNRENEVTVTAIQESMKGTDFFVNGRAVHIPLLGAWNAMNVSVAMGVGVALDVSVAAMAASVAQLEQVPGRMEFIDEGQPFTVIVDYAHEPTSLRTLYTFCRTIIGSSGGRLITLISSTGGGRDVGRRKKNGLVAGELCDLVIATDEDPYDDDPQHIIDQVVEGVLEAGKKEGVNMWRMLSRKEAIQKAFQMAQPGDVVLLTTKGAEQKMCVAGGKKIDWDDRAVAREILSLL